MLLKNVSKSYTQANGSEIIVLDHVSLELKSEKLSLILGPNGSGKSTLLRIAGFLESPSSGSVFFNGEDFTNPTPFERMKMIRDEIGIVVPYPGLLPYLTILENVMLPMINKNKTMAKEMLSEMELESMESYPTQLSVEDQQRASIARALINEPQILLVDEPTACLSPSSSTKIMEILKILKRKHTILMFTDDMELLSYSDTSFNLKKGVLV